MSLCYDGEKWLMITLASVAITLTIGLVTLAYGQEPLTEAETLKLIESRTLYKSPYLVVIDGSGVYSSYIGIILDHYIANGFEIKAIQGSTIFTQVK